MIMLQEGAQLIFIILNMLCSHNAQLYITEQGINQGENVFSLRELGC
jgi:hypothetical protein